MTAVRCAHDELPYIDEHSVVVQASAQACWASLTDMVPRAFSGMATAALARALCCADTAASGPRALAAGSTFPGFRVVRAEPPAELALEGSHRFSRYSLVFRVDALGAARSRLRAETRASFRPRSGRLYRALVIGTRGHVLVVRRLLASMRVGALDRPFDELDRHIRVRADRHEDEPQPFKDRVPRKDA